MGRIYKGNKIYCQQTQNREKSNSRLTMVSIPTISLKSSAGNCRQPGKTSSPVTNESTIISSNSEIKGMKKCYTCIDPGGTHQILLLSHNLKNNMVPSTPPIQKMMKFSRFKTGKNPPLT